MNNQSGFRETIKNWMLKLSSGQIILGLTVVGLFLVFIGLNMVSRVSGAAPATEGHTAFGTALLLIFLTVALLVIRLSILTKVGISYMILLLFGVQLVFGFWVVFAMILVTTYIYLKVAVVPTPIDFLITKGVQTAFAQLIYINIWLVCQEGIFRLLGVKGVMEHLFWVYMGSLVIYIFFMAIFLHIIAMDPIPMIFINAMMMILVQYFMVTYFGVGFIEYLQTYPPI